jgi:hypothetical protein
MCFVAVIVKLQAGNKAPQAELNALESLQVNRVGEVLHLVKFRTNIM